MLWISIEEQDTAVVLRLEGQLIGPWVEHVEQGRKKVFTMLGERSVQVDRSAVTFIDLAGGALLSRRHEAGFRMSGARYSQALMTRAIGRHERTENVRLHVGDSGRATVLRRRLMNTPYGLEIAESCLGCKLKRAECFCNLSGRVLKAFSAISHQTRLPSDATLFVEGQTPRGYFYFVPGKGSFRRVRAMGRCSS